MELEPSIPLEHERLECELDNICISYWQNCLADERARRGEIKERFDGLHRAILKTSAKLEDIEHIIRYIQVNQAGGLAGKELDGFDIDLFRGGLFALHLCCETFAKQRFSKKGSGAIRFILCCSSLWHLRERLTGRAFARNFDSGRDRSNTKGATVEAFVAFDARFVQQVMQAIDQKVSFKTIGTALREVARLPPGSPGAPVTNKRKKSRQNR